MTCVYYIGDHEFLKCNIKDPAGLKWDASDPKISKFFFLAPAGSCQCPKTLLKNYLCSEKDQSTRYSEFTKSKNEKYKKNPFKFTP